MKTSTSAVIHEITIEEIRDRYQPGTGRHWFDPATLRYFKGRLPQYGWEGPGGVFFVSSEKYDRCPRRYTVRKLEGPGRIQTVGQLNVLSKGAAVGLAKRSAMGIEEPVAPAGWASVDA